MTKFSKILFGARLIKSIDTLGTVQILTISHACLSLVTRYSCSEELDREGVDFCYRFLDRR